MTKKILIVEDEENFRILIGNKLKRWGYQIFLAEDGQRGLALAKKEKPNLILLDILMPVMDGLKMLKKVREVDEKMPVLILTNLSDKAKLAEALKLGSYQFLIKADHSLDEIAEKVKKVLG